MPTTYKNISEQVFIGSPFVCWLRFDSTGRNNTVWNNAVVGKKHENAVLRSLPAYPGITSPSASTTEPAENNDESYSDLVLKWIQDKRLYVLSYNMGILHHSEEILKIDYFCENSKENFMLLTASNPTFKKPTKSMFHYAKQVSNYCNKIVGLPCKVYILCVSTNEQKLKCFSV
jgi:hypothetical protein